MTAVLPLKQASRELIVEISQALTPYFADITARWREQLREETALDPRSKATLERITLAGGADYFRHQDFDGFFENLNYSSIRLANSKLSAVKSETSA